MPFFSSIYCKSKVVENNLTSLAECMAEFKQMDLYIGIPALIIMITILFFVLRKDANEQNSENKNEN